ncbi:MAG: hypothetical protein U0Q15_00595 [Kineosporiaceae bacterium]
MLLQIGACLVGVQAASSEAGFLSRVANTSSFAAGTLPTPVGLSLSRPCPSSGPTLKGSTTAAAASTSVSVSTPTAAAGDVLVAYVTASSGSGNASASGWNTLGQTSGGGMALTALYLPLSGAPAASYTFSWSAGTGSVLLASYTGVDPYSPVATMTTTSNTSGSTSATASTITAPRVPGRVVLGLSVAGAPTVSDPAAQTRRMSLATTDGLAGMTVWDGAISASGTTPAYSSSWTGSRAWLMLPAYLQSPVTAAKDPTVTLSWTASSAPATGFSLARSDGATFAISGAGSTGYTDTSTTAATSYTYTLRTTAGSWTSSGTATANASACP